MSFAPPIPNELAFFLRFFLEVGSLRDSAGRALHEVDFRNELSSSDERRCPYPGSRQGQRINQVALNGIVKDWVSIKTLMRTLVERTPALGQLTDARVQAWARSLVPMFLPTYVAYASRAVLDTTTSGLFKIMLDVPTTIDLMLAADCVTGRTASDCAAAAASEVARFAEGTGILNNGEWACAGPEKLIVEILDLLTASPERPQSDSKLPLCLESDAFFETYFLYLIQQYAVSQAFQICTAYGMENAFKSFRSTSPVESSASRPSAYATRRQLMLNLLVDEATTRRIVENFFDIASQLGRLITERAPTASLDAISRAAFEMVEASRVPVATVFDRQLAMQAALLDYVAEVRRLASSRWPALSAVRPIDASLFTGIDFPTRQFESLVRCR